MSDFHLSSDQIQRLCSNLVYQVAYSFYDAPYIILLKMLVHFHVVAETDLGQRVGLSANEVRKYMGILHLHRLVKRHVNREKQLLPEWKKSQFTPQSMRESSLSTTSAMGDTRTRDVHYWYLDYREFANVIKYRLAMMRKGIDERIKAEVGHRGYQCPLDGRTYDPLDLSHLFDPTTNSFKCEDCDSELVEHDPTVDKNNSSLQDLMQRFNISTAPIRDALKAVEGVTLPSMNIVVWLAQNVQNVVNIDGQEGAEDGKRFEVVIGGEDNEDKVKLAQAQREQNALPAWHTHSTVTGDATTLGLTDAKYRKTVAERNEGHVGEQTEVGDEALAAHYEMLAEDDEDDVEEIGVETGEIERKMAKEQREEEPESILASPSEAQMVTVNGQLKRLGDVTEEDQGLMTTDEYEAYAQAMYG
ncbi:uncharacterized protein L203_100990 [Cryptococcus depauperatus CBS 7841]|uniref:Uncharacterized protein n=1 Tax=Cryptococcus depauperatus CBS 7841 TaxID=1295531 RepID=A0A1E3I9S4_9TREE|nr:transcription initiation factor TFIIE subunit alpha [Cryptococcus depauperatus CBS 7841]